MILNKTEAERITNGHADRVDIVYYTDPLCCWSWALEPHWRKLLSEYGGLISYRYCMSGMIPDWGRYDDPLHAVNRPVQMGPVWMETKHLTGADIDDSIWVKDPPASSYPACVAVKAAGLQSQQAEDIYLARIRRAVMTEGINVAKNEVLVALATQCGHEFPDIFNAGRFMEDFNSEDSRQAFREDLANVRYQQIGRFPTLTITKPGGIGISITGYRPYAVLQEALGVVLE